MSKIKISISVEVDTNKSVNEFKAALINGVYIGLDKYRVAEPKNVKIKYLNL